MAAYYNEIDPQACEWLRNLINEGVIAPGDVDNRSIADVRASDLDDYTQCHFFAGIGVWSYALRQAGWCDDRPVWTGSCPCQPFSAAGKRGGVDDERHLWPEWFRLIRECRPHVIFGEQVSSKDALAWLDHVSVDLEGAHYALGALDLCSAGFGAPHIRQRLYFVADSLQPRRSQWRSVPWDGPLARRGESGVGLADATSDGCVRRGASEAGDGGDTAWVESERLRLVGGVGLADANGGHTSTEGLQRSGQHGLEQEDGRAVSPGVGLADAERGTSERRGHDVGGASSSAEGETRERQWVRHDAGTGRAVSGVAQGDADESRPQGWGVQPRDRASECSVRPSGPVNGFWERCDWIPCRDGKARPVEPGTFPLVTGATARILRLRAYGNCITSEVAKEFIQAFLTRDLR